MGKRFLRTIVQDFTTLAAVGEIPLVELPVNPMSFLVLTLAGEQPAAQATNVFDYLNDFLAAIDNVRVVRRGENLIQASLADHMMTQAALHGYIPHGTEQTGVAALRTMSFVLAFARRPYWPNEGLPAGGRQTYQFGFNVLDFTPGTFTTLQWALEACEMIESDPRQYLKYTTRTHTPTATGRRRLGLPLGNELVGVLLFDPASEIDATEEYFWGKTKVMVDNVEQYYAESNWESLRADLAMRIRGANLKFGHSHASDGITTSVGQELHLENRAPLQYGYLDFDPLMDGSYLLDTRGKSDVELDANSDVAAGTARYVPIELVQAGA